MLRGISFIAIFTVTLTIASNAKAVYVRLLENEGKPISDFSKFLETSPLKFGTRDGVFLTKQGLFRIPQLT
jgi:hypothetical protein